MLATIFQIIAKVLGLLGLYKQQQVTTDMRGQGVAEQKAVQNAAVLQEVADAGRARADVDQQLNADPSVLWNDDGFERK